ncbi:MAG TPA: type VI secretion system baseplate subunit TssF, partial [Polyangiaceae bacterium]|nr:type VI secretion system baseplate subunit TssF [Polyangiaceae bacterium]
MDRRLLSYYDRELAYLRELGSEFAEEFPKAAGKLGLSATDCADPHVERLLEGFAFLTARVQLSMDAEFPRFTEHLLDMIYPHCLAPLPSMAVVSLQPNPRQVISRQGFTLPRGTTLRADVPDRTAVACRYRTAHDVTLWPIEISGLSHESGSGALEATALRQLERGGRRVRSLLRLRLRSFDGRPISDLQIERLPLFLRTQDALGRRLFELCHTAALGVAIRRVSGSLLELKSNDYLAPLGFEDDQALLPHGARSFQGYRLLEEYFALPDRFAFVELRGLASGIARCSDSEVEILILLDRQDPELEAGLGIGHAQLFCTPVVNLFEHRADRIQLSDRTNEYHVVPDRTRPGDFEVHSVVSVTGHGEKGTPPRSFEPFYACTARTTNLADGGYFTVHRRQRAAPSRATGSRSGYRGSDTCLALVDGNEGPYRPSLRQLSVELLCSNRDLPLSLCSEGRAVHFQLDVSSPVLS